MSASMLTTVDNPFNPFTEFVDWLAYDNRMGYDTCNFMARLNLASEDANPMEQETAIDEVIDEIVKYNVLGLYRKVTQGEEIATASQST